MKNAEAIFPIYKAEHDCLVSAQGDLTIAFEATLPDIFTLSENDYAAYHQSWISAIKVLPKHSIVHKQDIFTRQTIKSQPQTSFLKEAANRHFEGRKYLSHRCLIMLTQKASDRKSASSVLSGLMRKNLVPKQTTDPTLHVTFEDKAAQFQRILTDSRYVALRRLSNDELCGTETKAGILEQYCFLQSPDERPMLKDIHLKDGLKIGNQYAQLFTISDAEHLPGLCGSRITYEPYSTDITKFPVGFATELGLLLDCEHIYNQYIFINDAHKTLQGMEVRKRRLNSLSAYSRENAISRDATNDFLNEAIGQHRLPVRAHFNVLAWTENRDELQVIKNQVGAAMAKLGASPKLESDGVPQLWWAGLPGNAADFPMNDTFDTFLEPAVCFFNLETNYSTDTPETGIRFCDRHHHRPVYVDLYDAPRHKGITSNMGTLVVGTSGGGKSVTVNHILETLNDQGAHEVIIDIGGSYKGLCELKGGYYFTYEETNPIKFNPFFLPPGQSLDTEKKESLKALLVALWKQEWIYR